MNRKEYIKMVMKYIPIIQEYKTKEERIEYLENCQWNIDMIDHWTDSDKLAYEVLTDLINYIKGEE